MAAAQEHILFFHYTENDEVTKYTQGTIHKTLFTDIIEFIKGAYFSVIVQELSRNLFVYNLGVGNIAAQIFFW